jgi:hypothetical protein
VATERITFLACEWHFAEHCAPIWHALPPEARGLFLTAPALVARGPELGIEMTAHTRGQPTGPAFVASWGDVQTARRSGRTRIARIEHGIGQSYAGDPKSQAAVHESYAGGKGQEGVSLFLTPNAHSADRWQRAYPSASVAIVGSPKIDALPAYEPEGEPIVAISTHFDARVCPETRSAFPLFQRAFVALAKRHRVIAHAHPRAAGEVSQWARRNGIEWVASLREVQRRAATYVCDNSSSMYEFAATGRPVVVLDIPTGRTTGAGYRRDINHGLRFWDAADVGVRIDDPADLPEAVRIALVDPPGIRENREAALDIVYAYRDGRAAERAAAALLSWAGQEAAVAA